ncbi:RhoGAP domain-containing protein [Polychytrium aggregatum]|uniref:RhoGAP domain-containing protein n=1 Tax=Polychytrium aggregatum TaxID=110093 RepID=UPI0022FDF54D|nr:RhoGAP domain-containing protein [Polychytrium aggregatum]KAI9202071.1 RhoGAP domain-containing protein [Polychytrium aggregatum]
MNDFFSPKRVSFDQDLEIDKQKKNVIGMLETKSAIVAQIASYMKARYEMEHEYANRFREQIKNFSSQINNWHENPVLCRHLQSFVQAELDSVGLILEQVNLFKSTHAILSDQSSHYGRTAKECGEAISKTLEKYKSQREIDTAKVYNAYKKDSEQVEKDEGNPQNAMRQRAVAANSDRVYRRQLENVELARRDYNFARQSHQSKIIAMDKDHQSAIIAAMTSHVADLSKHQDQLAKHRFNLSRSLDTFSADEVASASLESLDCAWPQSRALKFVNYQNKPFEDAVFKIDVGSLICKKEDDVPVLLRRCVEAIEARGLDREGLYRVSGNRVAVDNLKLLVEQDLSQVDLTNETHDVHVVAALVKQYLRELPVPLISFAEPVLGESEMHIYKREANYFSQYRSLTPEARKEELHRILGAPGFGRERRATLAYIIKHLIKVASHSEQNKMNMQNLEILFSAVLFRSEPDDDIAITEKSSWFGTKSTPTMVDSETALKNLLERKMRDEATCLIISDLADYADDVLATSSELPPPRFQSLGATVHLPQAIKASLSPRVPASFSSAPPPLSPLPAQVPLPAAPKNDSQHDGSNLEPATIEATADPRPLAAASHVPSLKITTNTVAAIEVTVVEATTGSTFNQVPAAATAVVGESGAESNAPGATAPVAGSTVVPAASSVAGPVGDTRGDIGAKPS